jgi:hypothetical protein
MGVPRIGLEAAWARGFPDLMRRRRLEASCCSPGQQAGRGPDGAGRPAW